MSSNYWDQILIGLSLISIHNDVSLNLIYTVTTESAGWAWLQSDLLNTTISDELLFSWMYLQTDDADEYSQHGQLSVAQIPFIHHIKCVVKKSIKPPLLWCHFLYLISLGYIRKYVASLLNFCTYLISGSGPWYSNVAHVTWPVEMSTAAP